MKKEIFKFRLSGKERNDLRAAAAAAGMTESAYIRLLIRNKPADHPEIREELKKTVAQVGKIGTNINQITRANNAALYTVSDKMQLKKDMEQLIRIVSELSDKLDKLE